MTGAVGPEDIARLLRQREELGMGELFLEGLTREQALALAAGRGRTLPVAAGPAAASSTEDATSPDEADPSSSGSGDQAEPLPPGAEGHDGESAYDALRDAALSCTRCALAEGRTQVVFSDGSPQARLMVVGEAPGAREDETGLPFVGPAGKLLDLLLATVGLSREESVYICNVLKCRPPGNRDPQPDEIATCSPYLLRQIELVSPEAILAVGSFSARLLTGKDRALGKLRGEVYSYHGVPLVVTYHPAALLRNAGWTRPTWDDFQLIRQILDGR